MNVISHLPTGLAAIFWGVLTFSILIVLHEGGHFLAARAFGVKVHEFMLGLPGPAIRWRSSKSGVTYGVTAIPLGGYVRIAGMEPGPEDELLAQALGLLVDRGKIDAADLSTELRVSRDRASALLATLADYGAAEPIDDWPESRSLVTRNEAESDADLLGRVRSRVYRGQRPWKRIVILSMGVIVNLLTALLVFTVVLTTVGEPTVSDKPVIGSVAEKSAAAIAGLRPGDVVVSIDGSAIGHWTDVPAAVSRHRPSERLDVVIRRGTSQRALSATLGAKPGEASVGFLGVGPAEEHVRLTVLTAVGRGFEYIGLTFVAIAEFFNPRTFVTSLGNARSVVGISYMVADAAQAGLYQYAWLIAVLSLSLGVMNILPIPPLDGGKVAVEVVEAALRRPLPKAVAYAASGVGTLLLFSLIFYLMYADVLRYIVSGG